MALVTCFSRLLLAGSIAAECSRRNPLGLAGLFSRLLLAGSIAAAVFLAVLPSHPTFPAFYWRAPLRRDGGQVKLHAMTDFSRLLLAGSIAALISLHERPNETKPFPAFYWRAPLRPSQLREF